MLSQTQNQRELEAGNTPVVDECQFLIFHMDAYYSLALLLTASEEDAESCFALALDMWSQACKAQYPRVEDIVHKSMKRALVDSAIEICHPVLGRMHDASGMYLSTASSASSSSPWIACILQLETFERFVFVLSVLESYSDQECAELLDCQPEEIADARVQAFLSMSAAWRNWHSYDA
jgi:hypothetical protein